MPEDVPKVAVPIKPPLDSRIVWILGSALALWLVSVVPENADAIGFALPGWLTFAARMASAALTGLGLLVRLLMPDIATCIPWFDRANKRALDG